MEHAVAICADSNEQQADGDRVPGPAPVNVPGRIGQGVRLGGSVSARAGRPDAHPSRPFPRAAPEVGDPVSFRPGTVASGRRLDRADLRWAPDPAPSWGPERTGKDLRSAQPQQAPGQDPRRTSTKWGPDEVYERVKQYDTRLKGQERSPEQHEFLVRYVVGKWIFGYLRRSESAGEWTWRRSPTRFGCFQRSGMWCITPPCATQSNGRHHIHMYMAVSAVSRNPANHLIS